MPQPLKCSYRYTQVTLHGETLEGVKEIVVDKVLIQADNGERELVLRGLFPTADVQVSWPLLQYQRQHGHLSTLSVQFQVIVLSSMEGQYLI